MRHFCLLASPLIASLLIASSAVAQATPDQITVTADAWTWSTADTARMTFAVQDNAANFSEAQQRVSAKAKKLTDAVAQASGNAAVSVMRGETFSGGGQGAAVQLRRMIGVEVRDMSLVGKVIDAALAADAQQVGSVEELVRDNAKDKLQAVLRATGLATQNAQSMANSLNTKLGQALEANVVEEPQGQVQREAQQMGKDTSTFTDQDTHVFVTLRYALVR